MKKATILSAAALSTLLAFAASPAAQAETKSEKCYGVVKAGKNDCGASGHSCAGHAAKDGDKNEWVLVPQGLCEKLVGGSTEKPMMDKK